jgi:hypothetical protein
VQILYDGFAQEGNNRTYSFHMVDDNRLPFVYSIQIDLALLNKHKVSLQSGPSFCLRLLQAPDTGNTISPGSTYRVVDADFASLLAQRAADAAAVASKKPARRPIRKPTPSSQLGWTPNQNFSSVRGR